MRNKGNKKRILFLAILLAFVVLPLTAAAATTKVAVSEGRVYITSKTYNLVSGATETVVTTNNTSGSRQLIDYILEVDAESYIGDNATIKIVASYMNYSYDELGLQTVTDQAAAYEAAHPGETVIAGINGDFYNMTTAEPTGAFVMNGVIYHSADGRPYFAILKDGTAVIRDGSSSDLSDVWQAVGGNDIIVTNGVNTAATEGDYYVVSYSRTAIGIKEDGSIVTYVTHGISVPTSCGETYAEVADMLIAQGCVTALMLDGGGSATYASLREGTDALTVQNSPSDGTPRTVGNTLLIVSTATSDGVFDHASLTPNNSYYTPTTDASNPTTVQFEATGIDASGAACDLPENLTWQLTSSSQSMGTIDENGLFTAAVGKMGTVGVELLADGQVVGSTEIQIVEPDDVYFNSEALSLDFDETTDLGLMVKGSGVDLIIKDGDLSWSFDKTLGSVTNNIFTSAPKTDETLTGSITVSYTTSSGTVLSATVSVEIGKLPVVALDFEIEDGESKDVVGLWDWGASSTYYSDGTIGVYSFQTYDYLYYLQSTTYSSDSQWIKECYSVVCPWVENEDGTVTVYYNNEVCIGTKTEYYGEYTETSSGTGTGTANKWVEFSTADGAKYFYRVLYKNAGSWGNYNNSKAASSILSADGYMMYVWHASANASTADSLNGEGSQIVDSSEGEVRFGNYALKLTYDYTNFSPTGSTKNCNTYYRMTDALVAEGSPTGLGMWVYVPEGMSNFWFWTQVTYWDGSSWTSKNIHFCVSGAEKTLQYSGINWTGWAYVEADLSSIYEAGAVVDEDHPIQVRSGDPLILLTYIPGGTSDGEGHVIVCGSKSAGYFYIDNVRWVYGTTVDDLDSPEIISVTANETALSADEVITLNTNSISFNIRFTDPQGDNYSGIDESGTQLYLDGSVLSSDVYAANADQAQTVTLTLANGEHELIISICDNFGNKTEKSYCFVVNNPDSDIPTVTIERETDVELGADYVITISADSLANIASVTTTINYSSVSKFETESKYLDSSSFYDDYGNLLTLGSDGLYYDSDGNWVEDPVRPSAAGDYSISSATQTVGENLTGTVRNKLADSTTRTFTMTATVNEGTQSNDTTIAVFTLPIPHTLAEEDTLSYNVIVTYTLTDGSTYTVTSGSQTGSLWAYYTITAGIQVSGSTSSELIITTADGKAVVSDDIVVYGDATTAITDGSWEDGVFTTSYFVNQSAGTTNNYVWVGDETHQHYSFYTSVSVADSASSSNVHYDLTLNATTKDSTTTQNITWFATTESNGTAQIQYMTKAKYATAYANAYAAAKAALADGASEDDIDVNAVIAEVFENANTAKGTATLTQFNADLVAAYINQVTVTGLSAGTSYVYRAGDGESWSEVSEFKTNSDDGSTTFVVVGDTQLTGNASSDESALAVLAAIGEAVGNVDFGIQTGDFVDGGIEYGLWDQILDVWGETFSGIDFIHVQGNHETYGTSGSSISAAIFGLSDSETAYYSVEYGDVYVAVINQSADLTEAAEWLVEDAAKTNCTWKIVVCHQPIYYTNPGGSSEGHNKVLAPACDAAGIDFVFSGHDHSYARTYQMYDGEALDLDTDGTSNAYIDENGDIAGTKGMGTVYYICGDLGEKSRESSYAIVNNASFNFAVASQDYNAVYITVEADENHMTVNTWNMSEDGTSTLIDTYTMYTNAAACELAGEHVLTEDTVCYNAETGMLVCERCGAEVDPAEVLYTGYAVDVNGEDAYGDSQYYFLVGKLQTGFFTMGEDFVYANAVGLIDHTTVNYTTNTCTTNGNNMAYSPRYNLTYTGGISRYTGHSYEEQADGSLVCTTCGHTAVDISGWNFSLSYTSTTYTGVAKTPAITIENPSTGETLEFHTDGTGIMSDYTRVWSNNKEVGTATVTINANSNGDYTMAEAVVLTLEIRPALPTSVTATAGEVGSVTLTWKASSSADTYVVYYSTDGTTWKKAGSTEDTSYEVTGLNQSTEYSFKIRAQKTVDGKTYNSLSYTDVVTATTSKGYDLSGYTLTAAWKTCTYSGNAKKPSVTVTATDGTILTKNTDYTVAYSDNVNVGTATITVTGKGDYYGEITTTFTIKQLSLTNTGSITAEDTVYVPGGATTTLTVVDLNGRTLTEDDYTVTYTDNDGVGRATVKITGTGNYSGTLKTTFLITQASIKDVEASVDEVVYYTGSALTPAVTAEGLTQGEDFEVFYTENVEAGTATVVLTGTGNYTDEKTVNFEILPADLSACSVLDGSTYSYTGEAVLADISVIGIDGSVLTENVDYEILGYANNVALGTATVTLGGLGNYSGTLVHKYKIQIASIAAFTVTLSSESYSYSGSARTPSVTVTAQNGTVLTEEVDYTVVYADNVNAGTATVTITGQGNYSGTAVKTFTINKADLTACTATLSDSSYTYSGAERCPTVTVKTAKGTTLKKGTNYTVTYVNNKNAGTATVLIEGIGNYGGTIEKTFTIKQAKLSKCSLSVSSDTLYADGTAKEPAVKVKTSAGTTLKEGVNYSVSYENNVEAGTATVTVTGINNYSGTLSTTFKIKAATDLSDFSATLKYTKTSYTGSEKCPSVTVKTTKGTTLKKDVNYTVTYSNNVNVGTATVTITGIGKYTGTIELTFTIRPAVPTSLKIVSVTKTSAKISFKRSDSADKYYIYVNGVYKGCAATVDYFTIKGLSAGKSYEVTVKAVKTVNGKKIYSSQSSILVVTTSK